VPAGDAAHDGPDGGVSEAAAPDEDGDEEVVEDEPAPPDCGDPDDGSGVAAGVTPSAPEPLAVGAPHPATATATATSRQHSTTA
jgi:hypothetical protein